MKIESYKKYSKITFDFPDKDEKFNCVIANDHLSFPGTHNDTTVDRFFSYLGIDCKYSWKTELLGKTGSLSSIFPTWSNEEEKKIMLDDLVRRYNEKYEITTEDLKEGSIVTFKVNDEELKYEVIKNNTGYYLRIIKTSNPNYDNAVIFKKLGIDKINFFESTLGYYKVGQFPYSKTLDDLKKVIKALKEKTGREVTFSEELREKIEDRLEELIKKETSKMTDDQKLVYKIFLE